MKANPAILNPCQQSIQDKHRMWVIITIMMLAILEVLDSTIVNVSLPSMMASLGANQNQITWVLTSYVVASAIVLPLTGFLTRRIGRKRFLFICASGFMLSSFFCGLSSSLSEIVIFRIIQGACGASLIPISQTIMRETFPLEQQGKAMAIWGIGILAAPVFGPTLGGFITQNLNWRWVFYINLPFCLIALFLIAAVIPKVKPVRIKIDMLSLILMVLGVGALQIFLDKGHENGWFNSIFILSLAVTAAFCILYFILRSAKIKNPIVKLSLFKDRNFTLCCILMMFFCGALFSFITLQPIMLENYFGYSAMTAGVTMGLTGILSAAGMMLSSFLMKKIKVKYIISLGLLIASIGLLHESQVNLLAAQEYFFISNALIGLGMGTAMVPLSTYVFATLDPKEIGEASGLFSYSRMLGTAIGISLIMTLVSQLTQTSWHQLVGFITPFNTNVTYWLQHQQLNSLTPIAVARLSSVVAKQSGIIGFIDAFRTLSLILLLLIPIALCLKSVKLTSDTPQGH